MRLVSGTLIWTGLLFIMLLIIFLIISCAGIIESDMFQRLTPARGAFRNYALASKGAWVLASKAFAGYPKTLVDSVFAWSDMRDTLTVHEQSVLSVIDGETSGGYWSAYEIDVVLKKADDGEYYPYAVPNYIEVTFPTRIQLSRIILYTMEEPTAIQATKVALEAYTLSYYNDHIDPPTWVPLATVSGNDALRRVHDFAPVNTWQIRLELSARSYWEAGWIEDESSGKREYKIPKVSEIQAYGIPVETDERPPPRPQPKIEEEGPQRKGKETVYYVSSSGDTVEIDPEKLKPVSQDSLAKIRAARAEKRKEQDKSEIFLLDPRGDVIDEQTGAAPPLPQIDLINARCFLDGDNYSFSLTVAGRLVGKGGKLTDLQCDYGFQLDLDGDGRFDLECRRSSYSYRSGTDVVAEYLDLNGEKHRIQEKIVAVTLFRNTLGLLVPAKYVGKIESFEQARLVAFTRMGNMVDRCVREEEH